MNATPAAGVLSVTQVIGLKEAQMAREWKYPLEHLYDPGADAPPSLHDALLAAIAERLEALVEQQDALPAHHVCAHGYAARTCGACERDGTLRL